MDLTGYSLHNLSSNNSLALVSLSSMHSHHSHSGDYISHAEGQLEEMVLTAKKNGFTHFCLTEHMPRLDDMYLYPEEIDKKYTKLDLGENFERYLAHARKIQARENALGDIKILVGYEVEGIDDAHIEAANLISKEQICAWARYTMSTTFQLTSMPISG